MDTQNNHESFQDVRKQALAMANKVWSEISPQLEELLGEDVFSRWFFDIIPLALNDNTLILQTNGKFSTMWITHNYLSKVNIILNLYQSNLKAKFVSPQEKIEIKPSSPLH